jgi:hypothetical protein
MTDPNAPAIATEKPGATASLARPWVLIRNGKAPPALARITRERWAETFYGELVVATTNPTTGRHEWRARYDYERIITPYDILHVFTHAPSPYWVAEARRALRGGNIG